MAAVVCTLKVTVMLVELKLHSKAVISCISVKPLRVGYGYRQ